MAITLDPDPLPGTAPEGTSSVPSTDTTPPAEGTSTETPPQKPAEESFIDPSTLPEELKPHWKRMHGAYTKRLEGLRSDRQALEDDKEKIDLVTRFRSDPAFAVEVIRQEAQRLGYSFLPASGNAAVATPSTGTGDTPPPQFVEAVKQNLSPELAWMAPSIAQASWAAVKVAVTPLVTENREEKRKVIEQQYDEMAGKLSETAPGWEQHEEEMSDLLDYLKSSSVVHPKFGAKLSLVDNLVTSNASATASAVRRMGEAGRSRTATGQSARSTVSSIEDTVRKAKTDDEAWDLAGKFAVESLKSGVQ